MATYGYVRAGVVAALNTQAAFDATDPTVQHLWQVVPDGAQVGDATALPDAVYTPPAPVIVEPPTPAPEPAVRKVSIPAFKMRFPFAKYAAVLAAKASDPGIQAWFDIVDGLTEIDLDDPHTAQALDYFVEHGYIDPDDKAAALA